MIGLASPTDGVYVALVGSFAFVQFAAIPPDHKPPVAEPPTLPPIIGDGNPSQKEGKGSFPTLTVGTVGIVTDKIESAGIVVHPLESSTFKIYVIGLEDPFGVPAPDVGVAFDIEPTAGGISSENEVAAP